MHSKMIEALKWGSKELEQIDIDLQRNLLGLKGFSFPNLMKMRLFFKHTQILKLGRQWRPKGQALGYNDSKLSTDFVKLSYSPAANFNVLAAYPIL